MTGTVYNGTNNDMVIWRYLPDGTLPIQTYLMDLGVIPLDTNKRKGFVTHNNAAGGNKNHGSASLIINPTTSRIYITGSSEDPPILSQATSETETCHLVS